MADESTQVMSALAVVVPLTYALFGWWAGRGGSLAGARGVLGAGAGFGAAALLVGLWFSGGAQPLATRLPAHVPVRMDAVTAIVLGMVAFLALVLARYSRVYLQGERGQARSTRWLLWTVAAVTTLVLTNHLAVLALAWTAAGLALHQLLTFFADRPQALVAAHKKFLASRVADACVLAAALLLSASAGNLELDTLADWAQPLPSLPPAAQVAAVLLVLGVALKSAQLPFHGWLIQVMEAPTPVSALLHAGVVNMGGLVMIRLAPVMAKAPVAQGLLVAIGTATAVLAALVMMTRVSVKVSLAWSTCAQMGFMLVQCGLGAWQLALLHLVAHSLYKAHAFLSSGSAVDVARVAALTPASPRVTLRAWLGAGGLALAVATLASAALGADLASWTFAVLASLALVPALVRAVPGPSARFAAAAGAAFALASLSFAGHALISRLHVAPAGAWASAPAVAFTLAAFVALFVTQGLLHAHPDGRLARALYPRLFAGLFLDERFTRLTFRLWPPRLPSSTTAPPLRVPETREA